MLVLTGLDWPLKGPGVALTGSEPRLPWRKLWRMLWRCPFKLAEAGPRLPAASAKVFSLLLLPASRCGYLPPNNCNGMQGCVRRGHALLLFSSLFPSFLRNISGAGCRPSVPSLWLEAHGSSSSSHVHRLSGCFFVYSPVVPA